jgi:hypothetical protein
MFRVGHVRPAGKKLFHVKQFHRKHMYTKDLTSLKTENCHRTQPDECEALRGTMEKLKQRADDYIALLRTGNQGRLLP